MRCELLTFRHLACSKVVSDQKIKCQLALRKWTEERAAYQLGKALIQFLREHKDKELAIRLQEWWDTSECQEYDVSPNHVYNMRVTLYELLWLP